MFWEQQKKQNSFLFVIFFSNYQATQQKKCFCFLILIFPSHNKRPILFFVVFSPNCFLGFFWGRKGLVGLLFFEDFFFEKSNANVLCVCVCCFVLFCFKAWSRLTSYHMFWDFSTPFGCCCVTIALCGVTKFRPTGHLNLHIIVEYKKKKIWSQPLSFLTNHRAWPFVCVCGGVPIKAKPFNILFLRQSYFAVVSF